MTPRRFLLAMLVVWGWIFHGCAHSPTAPEAGIRIHNRTDPIYAAKAENYWDQVETCVGKTATPNIDVYITEIDGVTQGMPYFNSAQCGGNVGGCTLTGKEPIPMWVTDYMVYSPESIGHEMIHVLLWKTTGDSDPKHTGPYWANGKACQVVY